MPSNHTQRHECVQQYDQRQNMSLLKTKSTDRSGCISQHCMPITMEHATWRRHAATRATDLSLLTLGLPSATLCDERCAKIRRDLRCDCDDRRGLRHGCLLHRDWCECRLSKSSRGAGASALVRGRPFCCPRSQVPSAEPEQRRRHFD